MITAAGRGPEFRILGPLEVRVGGNVLRIVSARQRSLLAVLLLSANEIVSKERLVDELWAGERSLEQATNQVHLRIYRLRRLFTAADVPGVIATRPPGYLLRVGPEQVDLARFDRAVGEARKKRQEGDLAAAARCLRSALALWRGPAFDGLTGPVLDAARARLSEQRLVALEDCIEAELALGHHADLVGELTALLVEHPLRERLCGQLMLALYRSGRQADALESYQAMRTRLVGQLGLEPGRRLQHLQQAILNADPVLTLEPTTVLLLSGTTGGAAGRGRETVRRWVGQDHSDRAPGRSVGLAGAELEELLQLRRHVAEVEAERDTLRRAVAYLAKIFEPDGS